MNKKAPLLFGIVLILLCTVPFFAQSQEKSITRLKLENNRLRAIAEDKNNSAEIRELNQQLLQKNTSLLREAILKGIAALEDYQTKNADILDDNDRKEVNEKIEAHKYDLAQIGVKDVPKSEIGKPMADSVAAKTNSPQPVTIGRASFLKKTDTEKAVSPTVDDTPTPTPTPKPTDTPPPPAPTFVEPPKAGNSTIRIINLKPGDSYQISVNGNDPITVKAEANGSFSKTLTGLSSGDKVIITHLVDNEPKADEAFSENVVRFTDPSKGGIFGVLVGGIVLSQQNQNYGQASPFFGFNAGWGSRVFGAKRLVGTVSDGTIANLLVSSSNDFLTDSEGRTWQRVYTTTTERDKLIYRYGNKTLIIDKDENGIDTKKKCKDGDCLAKLNGGNPLKTFRWNFRFQGIFEADGRKADGKTTGTGKEFTFIASQQTFTAQAETWFEFRPMRAFSFGPYATYGASALVDKTDTTSDSNIVKDTGEAAKLTSIDRDLKRFYEFGGLINLRFPDQKFFLQSIMGYGNYEQYQGLYANHNTKNRFVAKLRIFPEGLNTTFGEQISLTPMFGVDLNAGRGPDHLRFFTGFTVRLKGINTQIPD